MLDQCVGSLGRGSHGGDQLARATGCRDLGRGS